MSRQLVPVSGDRLLISRTDRLGDLVLALPLVQTIKARFPECLIDVAASDYAAPILENHPAIANIIRVNRSGLENNGDYRRQVQGKISAAGYRAVIVLFPEKHISRIYKKAGIPWRLGTAGRWHSLNYNVRMHHSRKKNIKHEAEYNLDFLKFFPDGVIDPIPKVYLSSDELAAGRALLNKKGIAGEFIVLHPGSGGSADRWPTDKFIDLYKSLESRGWAVVFTGSAEEGRRLDETVAGRSRALNKITGETDLRILAAVLSRASAVVANSTGPLHLGAAVGARVIGLYPAAKGMSPIRWGPLGSGQVVIQPKTARAGMSSITIEEVAAAVEKIMMKAIERTGRPQ